MTELYHTQLGEEGGERERVLMFTQRAKMKFWPSETDSYVDSLAIHFTYLCDIMHLISEKVSSTHFMVYRSKEAPIKPKQTVHLS